MIATFSNFKNGVFSKVSKLKYTLLHFTRCRRLKNGFKKSWKIWKTILIFHIFWQFLTLSRFPLMIKADVLEIWLVNENKNKQSYKNAHSLARFLTSSSSFTFLSKFNLCYLDSHSRLHVSFSSISYLASVAIWMATNNELSETMFFSN